MAKSMSDQVKEAFEKVRHEKPPKIEYINTDQHYDWTPRPTKSAPCSPRTYKHRQEQLEKEKQIVELKTNEMNKISSNLLYSLDKEELNNHNDSEFLKGLKEYLQQKHLKKQLNTKPKKTDNPFLEESDSKIESYKHDIPIVKVSGISLESSDI